MALLAENLFPARLAAAALIALHDALAAGVFQLAAHISGFGQVGERPNHGAVIDALVAEIGAADDRLPGSQHIREFCLQSAERSLRVGLTALRRHLNVEAAIAVARSYRTRGRRRGGGGSNRGRS